MILINYLTNLLTINEFISSVLLPFLNSHIFEGIAIITLIHLASKAGKILDATAKVVAIAAGSTILYNNWVKPSSSGGDDDKERDKKSKNQDNNGSNKK